MVSDGTLSTFNFKRLIDHAKRGWLNQGERLCHEAIGGLMNQTPTGDQHNKVEFL